ncbi:MAG: hypothetical protein CMF59_02320 [Leptospiraceae bacterium]|nr:hypothetical protein [Leptospiraceae bacterium]
MLLLFQLNLLRAEDLESPRNLVALQFSIPPVGGADFQAIFPNPSENELSTTGITLEFAPDAILQ